MQQQTSHLCSVLVSLGVLAVAGLAPATVAAQERTHDRILILTLMPVQSGDSAYVHEMTHFLRSRAQNKFRHKWQVITTEKVHELFVSSGFAENTIIGPEMVDQVARSLQAHGYMYGTFDRSNGKAVARYRMVDVTRSGLSGWLTVEGQPGDPPKDFADHVADSLDNQVRAADYAKDCTTRRDRSDFKGARDRADRAFAIYENHPSSAICLSYVFEAERAPADSMVWAYRKAAQGDSLYMRAWEELARQYQRLGDTAGAVEAFARQLDANPADMEMRYNTAAGYMATQQHDRALAVINQGLEREPDNLRFLRLKNRVCLDGEDWQCALESSSRLYEVDTTLVGSIEFYGAVIGLATQVADTAAMLRWSGEALQYDPNSVRFWQLHTLLLDASGMADSAFVGFQKLVELNPGDIRSKLQVATKLGERFTVDTLLPLDTAMVERIDGLLQDILTATGDSNIATAIGVEYLKGAQKLVPVQPELGVQWADKALANDPRGLLTTQANFWLGYGLFLIATPMDQQIVESQSCRLLPDYQNYLRRSTQALTIGRSVSEETASQLLGYLQQLAGRPEQFRQSFCP